MNTLLSQFNQHMKKYGVAVTIENTDTTVFFKEYQDNVNPFDNKWIFSYSNLLGQGNVIDSLDKKWIVLSKPTSINNTYDKSIVRECPFTIKFYDENTDSIYEYPVIIETKTLDVETNQYVSLPVGKIIVTIPTNSFTSNLNIDRRFIKMDTAWRITGIDKSNVGIIRFYCNKDTIGTNDNMELEIANYSVVHYEILVNNTTPIEVEQGKTFQLNVTVKQNDIDTSKLLLYTSSNNDIAMIDKYSGLITGISPGIVTICINLYDKPDESINVNVEVKSIPIGDRYNVLIIGSNEMQKIPTPKTYTANIYNNGELITDNSQGVTWSISDNSKIQITYQDDKTIKIKGLYDSGGFQLKAELVSDNSIFSSKTITLKSPY